MNPQRHGPSHNSQAGPASPYERDAPSVDLRVVLFTVSEGKLWIALQQGESRAELPNGRPVPDESLDVSATRIVADELGIEERYKEQLYTISQRSDGEWAVTIAYLGLALGETSSPPQIRAEWHEAANPPDLDLLDQKIFDYALLRLRAKLGYTTIAFHLLPPEFSLSALQQVYEAVLGRPLDKRNFRRRIQTEGFLEATGEARRVGSHRPARLFRFRAAHDADTYLTPGWATNHDRETTAS